MSTQCRTFKFTHRSIEALPPQEAGASSTNIEYTDAVESGLRIAVYKSGKRSFRHRYTYLGIKKMMTLGEFPAVNVERARERVRENKALLAEDIDPREERQARRDAISFKTFAIEHFMPFAEETMRSFKDVKSRVNVWLIPNFGEKKIDQINKQSIAKFHLSLRQKPPTANRCLSLLSAMFRYAIECGLAVENPCRGISKIKENGPRKRVLSSDEKQRFMTELQEAMTNPQGKAIFLLLMTGKRKRELLSSRWSNIDWDNRRIHIPMTKSGKAGFALLNDLAYAILRQMERVRDKGNDWIFPSDSETGHLLDIRRTFKSITKKAGIKDFTIHGLRHEYASTLLNSNVPVAQISALLGHADIRTTMIYAHLNTASLQKANETAGKEMEKFMA